jgi:hypothetical protein
MKPKIAEKAQDEGGTLQRSPPTPQAGLYAPTVPRKKDQQQAARIGAQPQDGEGNGIYSEFLARWAKSITDTYNAAPVRYHCFPVLVVGFQNGHVMFAQPEGPKASCGDVADEALIKAVFDAPRPPPPIGFGGDQQNFILYQHDEGR